jgi:hypothetical protein
MANLSLACRLAGTKTWLLLRVSKSACAHYRSPQRRQAIEHGLMRLSEWHALDEKTLGEKETTGRTCLVKREEPESSGIDRLADLRKLAKYN